MEDPLGFDMDAIRREMEAEMEAIRGGSTDTALQRGNPGDLYSAAQAAMNPTPVAAPPAPPPTMEMPPADAPVGLDPSLVAGTTPEDLAARTGPPPPVDPLTGLPAELLPVAPPEPVPGMWTEFKDKFLNSATYGNMGLYGETISDIGKITGSTTLQDWGDRMVKASEFAPKSSTPLSISDLFDEESLATNFVDAKTYVAQQFGAGLGSMVPPIVLGLTGTAVGGPGVGLGAAFAGASLPMAYGEVKQSIKAQLKAQGVEADPERIMAGSLLTAIPIALLDTVGARALGAMGLAEARKSVIQRLTTSAVGRIGGAAATEGGTEGLQQVLEETYTALYDTNPDLARKAINVLDAAVGGALVGGGIRTVTAPFERATTGPNRFVPPDPTVVIPEDGPEVGPVPTDGVPTDVPLDTGPVVPPPPPSDGVGSGGVVPPAPADLSGDVIPPVVVAPDGPVGPVIEGTATDVTTGPILPPVEDPTLDPTLDDPTPDDPYVREPLYIVVPKDHGVARAPYTRLLTGFEAEHVVSQGGRRGEFDLYEVNGNRVVPSRYSGSLVAYGMAWPGIGEHTDLVEALDAALPEGMMRRFTAIVAKLHAVPGMKNAGDIGRSIQLLQSMDNILAQNGVRIPPIAGSLVYHGDVDNLRPELVDDFAITDPVRGIVEEEGQFFPQGRVHGRRFPLSGVGEAPAPIGVFKSPMGHSFLQQQLDTFRQTIDPKVYQRLTTQLQKGVVHPAYSWLKSKGAVPELKDAQKVLGQSLVRTPVPKAWVGAQFYVVPSSAHDFGEVRQKYLSATTGTKNFAEVRYPGRPSISVSPQVDYVDTGYVHAESLAKVLAAVMKKYVPDQHVTLAFPQSLRGDLGLYHTGLGVPGMKKNEHLIELLPGTTPYELMKSVFTLAHEFGHLLMYSYAEKGDSGLVYRAYAAYRLKAAGWLGARDQEEFFRVAASSQNFFGEIHTLNDWYSFAEWFSTQYELQATKDPTFIEMIKHFAPLDAAFKMYQEKVREQLGKAFEPDVEFVDFLADTLAKNPSSLANGVNMARGREIVQQEILDAVDIGPRSNPHPQSVLLPRMNKVPKPHRVKIQRAVAKFNWSYKWFWDVLQLAEANKYIAPLQKYVEHIGDWHQRRMQWISRADQTLRDWRRIGAEEGQKVSDVLFEVQKMKYVGSGQPRWPTPQELDAIFQQYKLGDPEKAIYHRVVGDFKVILRDVFAVLERDAKRMYPAGSKELTEKLKQLSDEYRNMASKPYFPYTRFGRFHVAIKKKGVTVYREAFESKRRRDSEAQRISGLTLPGETVVLEDLPSELVPFMGLPPQLLAKLETTLVLTNPQRKLFKDLVYEMSPAHSFNKHLMRKDRIGGYSTDGMRAYADYFFHAANHLARIEYTPFLNEDVLQMGEYIRQRQTTSGNVIDVSKLNQIKEYMEWHQNDTLNPSREWHSLQGMAFLWFFGFDPLSAAMNFFQTPMVTMPRMSKIWGSFQTGQALTGAMVSLRGLLATTSKALAPDERRAIDKLVEIGSIDQSFAEDLAGLSNGNVLKRLYGGETLDRTWRTGTRWAAYMFHTSEKLQRYAAGLATYRLVMKDPGKLRSVYTLHGDLIAELQRTGFTQIQAEAIASAKEIIRNTHFEHARWAKPRAMRGKKASLFVFMNYMRNMMWIVGQRPERWRVLFGVLALSGVMGLPGAEDAEDIAKAVANLMGYNINPTADAHAMLEYVVDEPDWILHGASRHSFGLAALGDMTGFPMPDTDLSGRLSLGRVLGGVPQAAADITGPYAEGDIRQAVGTGASGAGGAAFNMIMNIGNALYNVGSPDFRRHLEMALPRSMRNLATAYRYYEEEAATSFQGEKVAKFDMDDPMHLAEIAATALGAAPTRVRTAQEERRWVRERARFLTTMRSGLMEEYWDALQTKDRETRQDVMEGIKEFNRVYGRDIPSVRITGEDLRESMKRRRKGALLTEKYGESTPSAIRTRRAVERQMGVERLQ